ncbi:Galactinol synthase 2 [Vitis vinifera]|uniref:Galactinol synthase 2 n=1 Tax=Vitis vinifera TaxID=29760 RepID=A0A438IML6_VITVI|nr:Galactinol synthase 2 [Vitis vinifera]
MPVMTKSSIVKMEEEGRLLSRKGKETYGKVFESNGGWLAVHHHHMHPWTHAIMTWTMTIMHAPGMTINSQLSQMTESSLKEYSPTTAPFEDPIEKIHSLPVYHTALMAPTLASETGLAKAYNLSDRAYVTFLAENGDYVKGVVGLAKGLRKVKTAYPLVVAVLPDVQAEHRRILEDQGCVIRGDRACEPAGEPDPVRHGLLRHQLLQTPHLEGGLLEIKPASSVTSLISVMYNLYYN